VNLTQRPYTKIASISVHSLVFLRSDNLTIFIPEIVGAIESSQIEGSYECCGKHKVIEHDEAN